ncbi:uncharacterized protein isoform X2 [Rhodnius prolixus]|uniref:uncharacterized protein isoform X2 n=1 Tax=Rhodnius prolixus TaxID=13249 RepID=UPI003D18ABE7
MRILANIFIKKVKTQAIIQGVLKSNWRHLCTACDDNDKQTMDEILSKNEPTKLECQNEDFIDLSREITLRERESLTPLHPEVPCDYLRDRVAYIRKRPKHVMQQGTSNTHSWILKFNRSKTWENPLIEMIAYRRQS